MKFSFKLARRTHFQRTYGLILLAFVLPYRVIGQPIAVNHPVYPFLRQLEMRGVISSGRFNTLPRPKDEVLGYLQAAERDSVRLTPGEKKKLTRYLVEMDPERRAKASPLTHRDSLFSVNTNLEFYSKGVFVDSIPKTQRYTLGTATVGIDGEYRQRLRFVSAATIGSERSATPRFLETYDPLEGMPYNTNREGKSGVLQGVSTFDGFRTVVGYDEGSLRIEAGQDWNSWGPGIWQHASLGSQGYFWVQDSLAADDSSGFPGSSRVGGYRRGYRYPGESSPLTQVRLGFTLGRFDYSKVIARRSGLWRDSVAQLVAHRLNFRAGKGINIGLFEMVAYAGRDQDLLYLIPLVPIKYAEHQLGDRDNIALGGDIDWVSGHGFRLYGELLLDDFSGLPLSFWGNKYALTLGGETSELPCAHCSVALEYALVSPWVYGHHKHDTQFQSLGALIGSSLPPNAQSVHARWDYDFENDWLFGLEGQWQQRVPRARNASIFTYHDNAIDGTERDFLVGPTETRNALWAKGQWQWRRYLTLRATAGILSVTTWHGALGQDLISPLVSAEMVLNYF